MKGKALDDTAATKIKEAAREVFTAKGYDGATMQAIADLAGYNKAQLHYYFRSKDALFFHIFKEEMQLLLDSLLPMLEEPGLTLRAKLERWIDAEVQFFGAFPKLPLFLISELHRNPDMIQSFFTEVRLPQIAKPLMAYNEKLELSHPGTKVEDLIMMAMSLILGPILLAPMYIFMTGADKARWERLRDRQIVFAKKLFDDYLYI